MDWKIFLTIFVSVFIAELGDKTQLATMLFAADKAVSKTTVFLAASAALVVSTFAFHGSADACARSDNRARGAVPTL